MTRRSGDALPKRNDPEPNEWGVGWWVQISVDGCSEAVGVAEHLARFGCRVAAHRGRSLLVEVPSASGRAAACADAELYLSMWRTAHPRSRAAPLQPHRPPRAA